MIIQILIGIAIIIAIYLFYKHFIVEGFWLFNPYQTYSTCVEDLFGDIKCYDPKIFYKYYWPYYRASPGKWNSYRRIFRRY